MGAAFSTNVATSVVNDVSKVFNETVQNCTTTSTQEIDMTVGNSGVIRMKNGSITQKSSINTKCLADQFNNTDMEAKIKKAITENSGSKIDGIGFGVAASTNVATSVDNITKEINVKNIQNAITANIQKMSLKAGDNGLIELENWSIEQSNDIVNKVVQDAVSKSKTVTDLNEKFDQTAKAELIGIFSTTFLIVLLAILGIWFFAGGKGKKRAKKWAQKAKAQFQNWRNNGGGSGFGRFFGGAMRQQPPPGQFQAVYAVPPGAAHADPPPPYSEKPEGFVAGMSSIGSAMILACIFIVALLGLYMFLTC